jgi:GH35 family endo-1,4-beta-xylanase
MKKNESAIINRSRRRHVLGLLICAAAQIPAAAWAQTSLPGSMAALRSGGSATLGSPSYLGTYVTVPAGGATVKFTVNATAASGAGANPHMNVVVDDTIVPFSVSSTSATNYITSDIFLPAGTHFFRNERDYSGNVGVSRAFTVNTISVNTVSGSAATFSNTSNNTNALAAADTYINNFRKGSATIALTGPGNIPLLPGTPIVADLARHAFTFGTAIPGLDPAGVSSYLGSSGTSQQTNYQSRLNLNFNAVAPENAGKWKNNEATRDVVTMSGVDTMLNYAKTHNQRARMHNLIWGDGSNNGSAPAWVLNDNAPPNDGLLDKAYLGDTTAKNDLRAEITERIGYYVGTGSASDRALKYTEIDVNNESWHRGPNPANTYPHNYWNVYGASGVAGIHNEVAAAIAASGSTAKVFVNEYNVFQNSNDAYAKWLLDHTNVIRDAGGNVGGIGIQYYPDASIGAGDTQHTPSRIASVLQNLSVDGLPLTLTEFAVDSGVDATVAANILQDSVRLMFGTPQAGGFVLWGFQSENGGANLGAGSGAAFYTLNTSDWNTWTITEAGKRWQDMLGIQDWDGNPNNAWDTNVALVADANGQVNLSGAFYGDYYLSGQGVGANNAKLLPFDFTLAKGTSSYSTALAKPPNWFFWKTNGSGNWGTGGNWTDAPQSGASPNAPGFTAYFGSSATFYDLGGGASAGTATTTNITNAVTVTVTSAVTAGMLVFEHATRSYTINASGSGSITLAGYNNASGHAARIYVKSGSHTINAPMTLSDNTEIQIDPAGAVLTISNDVSASSATITKLGAGTVQMKNVRAAGLTVNAGTLRVMPNGTIAGQSVVGTLSIAPTAALDLNDNDLVVNSGSFSALQALVLSGYRGGPDSEATGIVSTTSQTVHGGTTILALFDNSLAGFSDYPFGSGNSIAAGAIVGKYTYIGDTNYDGQVTPQDYTATDSNLGTSVDPAISWFYGDTNFDGNIDPTDYAGIDGALGLGQGNPLGLHLMGVAAVPEPGLVGVALGGIFLTLSRRRNHRQALLLGVS